MQVELARLPADDPRRGQLHERQARLLETHRREWLPARWSFSPYPPETWERGFVTRVEKQGGRLTREDAESLAAVPTLVDLPLAGTGVNDDEFRLLPPLPNLREFSLGGSEELTVGAFALLTRWPALHTLGLMTAGLTDAGLAHVAALRRLRSPPSKTGSKREH